MNLHFRPDVGYLCVSLHCNVQSEVRWLTMPLETALAPTDKVNYYFIDTETAISVNQE